MSIELTTQITAMHTTDKEFEENNCATWKAKCSNYNLVFYGQSYEEVIDEACKKIEELYTSGNLQLVNQRGLRVRRGTQKVVVEVSIGVNPNTTLDMFQDGTEIDGAAEERDPASEEREEHTGSMTIMFGDDGVAQLVLSYRCKECGEVISVIDSLEEDFKEKNPACPKCHAENCWEPVEEHE